MALYLLSDPRKLRNQRPLPSPNLNTPATCSLSTSSSSMSCRRWPHEPLPVGCYETRTCLRVGDQPHGAFIPRLGEIPECGCPSRRPVLGAGAYSNASNRPNRSSRTPICSAISGSPGSPSRTPAAAFRRHTSPPGTPYSACIPTTSGPRSSPIEGLAWAQPTNNFSRNQAAVRCRQRSRHDRPAQRNGAGVARPESVAENKMARLEPRHCRTFSRAI